GKYAGLPSAPKPMPAYKPGGSETTESEPPSRYRQDFNTATYDRVKENPLLSAATNRLSLFSIDVDAPSSSNARRFINSGPVPHRLPLVKKDMRLLVHKLTEKDRVAIVIYAGGSGLALNSTSGNEKEKILRALEELQAGGSTNGAEGIELAYKVAADNFIKGG